MAVDYSKLDYYAKLAVSHTKEMREKYPKEIADCVANTKHYKEPLNVEIIHSAAVPSPELWDRDSLTAAFEAKEKYNPNKIAILNFASFKFPGGKFKDGFMNQEEDLCHKSYLYNILENFTNTYYRPHLAPVNLNQHLYRNEALYTPNIRFTDEDKEDFFDVVTISAPNFKTANRLFRVDPERNKRVLELRIQFLNKILTTEQVDCVILGAFGCGVFGQAPHMVAQIFNDTFKNSTVNHIIYAVPKSLNETNYNVFNNRIGKGE